MKSKVVSITGVPFVSHVNQTARPVHEFDLSRPLSDNNIERYGVCKLMGYKYDLRPYLRLFAVKQYDFYSECYAVNKTLLRKSLHGRIQRIVEII